MSMSMVYLKSSKEVNKKNNLEELQMKNLNQYELIALLEAHGKAAVAAGVENNFKGNIAKYKKHMTAMEQIETRLNEITK
jgi:hypothetical protein